jgi:hypothetical protein
LFWSGGAQERLFAPVQKYVRFDSFSISTLFYYFSLNYARASACVSTHISAHVSTRVSTRVPACVDRGLIFVITLFLF